MRRTVVGLLTLLLLLPALWARDDKDKKEGPATPAEQYQALVKEYTEAQQAYTAALRGAKTQEERQKVTQEKAPKINEYTPRFLALARKHQQDPIALDALAWVIANGPFASRKDVEEAMDMVLKDHVNNPQIAKLCPNLGATSAPGAEKLLRAILEQNPTHEVQGIACLALATRLHRQALAAERGGKEDEAKKSKTEADELFDRVAGEFADIPAVQRSVLTPGSPLPSAAIRRLIEKTTDKNAKGIGYYTLAQRLKQDAEKAADQGKNAEAEKAYQEAEQLLEKIAGEFTDVPYGRNQKLGAVVTRDLFEIRHLAIGKPVAEIEGEDLDGKKFKLSDYKGKVVLLDFWGNW